MNSVRTLIVTGTFLISFALPVGGQLPSRAQRVEFAAELLDFVAAGIKDKANKDQLEDEIKKLEVHIETRISGDQGAAIVVNSYTDGYGATWFPTGVAVTFAGTGSTPEEALIAFAASDRIELPKPPAMYKDERRLLWGVRSGGTLNWTEVAAPGGVAYMMASANHEARRRRLLMQYAAATKVLESGALGGRAEFQQQIEGLKQRVADDERRSRIDGLVKRLADNDQRLQRLLREYDLEVARVQRSADQSRLGELIGNVSGFLNAATALESSSSTFSPDPRPTAEYLRSSIVIETNEQGEIQKLIREEFKASGVEIAFPPALGMPTQGDVPVPPNK